MPIIPAASTRKRSRRRKRYITLHPGSPDAAYAEYLIAASYFDQIPDVTRDQADTEKALHALEEVARKYPDYGICGLRPAQDRVCQGSAGGKEMQVGRYYLDHHDYTGAINRFKVVVTHYQRTRHVEEALMRLTEAYMALGIVLGGAARPPPCSGTISPTAAGTRTPTSW